MHSETLITLYVAPSGHDDWSGSLPAPNRDLTDGPLASLAGARDALRRLKDGGALTGPATVYVRGGTYTQREEQIARRNKIWASVILLDRSGEPGPSSNAMSNSSSRSSRPARTRGETPKPGRKGLAPDMARLLRRVVMLL